MNLRIITLAFLLAIGSTIKSLPAQTPEVNAYSKISVSSNELKESLRPHPRLILTDSAVQGLRGKIEDAEWARDLERELHLLADELVDGQKLQGWRPGGWKLAGTGAVSQISALALAYRLHGDQRYLDEAEKSLRQIAQEVQKKDVGVEYLKRAAVLTGLAIGFDWLHDDLSPETLDLIEQGILEGGLRDLIERERYSIPGNNWTTVCYGGTAIAALAIAERQPELASKAITKAIQLLPSVTSQYQPDGISFEGPHYWDFPTMYHAMLTDSLRTGLGDDFGLATSPGLKESFDWRLVARAPSGDDFAYGDGERVNRAVQAMCWAAKQYDRAYLVSRDDLQRMMTKPERLKEKTWMVFPLVWLPANAVGKQPPNELLAFRGAGPSSQVIFRSSWDDPDALWLAIKGGKANVSHGHMDVGSFLLEAGGVRWFEELETHHYFDRAFRENGITDIWSYDNPESDRWKVYAWNNRGHNTLTVDDQLHAPNKLAEVITFSRDMGEYAATLDLSKVLGRKVAMAARRFEVFNDKSILIEDRWTAQDDSISMRARFHTYSDIHQESDQEVVLRRDGRSLVMTLEGTEAKFQVAPALKYMNPWDRQLEKLSAISVEATTPARTQDSWRFRLTLNED